MIPDLRSSRGESETSEIQMATHRMVIHPSINRARRRVTTLIETSEPGHHQHNHITSVVMT